MFVFLSVEKIDEVDDEASITELVPEIASNVELGSVEETFTMCQDNTMKHSHRAVGEGGDFLSVQTNNDHEVESGRHS